MAAVLCGRAELVFQELYHLTTVKRFHIEDFAKWVSSMCALVVIFYRFYLKKKRERQGFILLHFKLYIQDEIYFSNFHPTFVRYNKGSLKKVSQQFQFLLLTISLLQKIEVGSFFFSARSTLCTPLPYHHKQYQEVISCD